MTVKVNPKFLEAVREAAATGVVAGANIIRTEAVRLVRETPKSGSVFRRRGVEHKRSAPGEPYASDTGNTLQQISEPALSEDGLTATVFFRGENAKRMEFGTENMAPRPVAAPAVQNKGDEARRAVEDELAKVFRSV